MNETITNLEDALASIETAIESTESDMETAKTQQEMINTTIHNLDQLLTKYYRIRDDLIADISMLTNDEDPEHPPIIEG